MTNQKTTKGRLIPKLQNVIYSGIIILTEMQTLLGVMDRWKKPSI